MIADQDAWAAFDRRDRKWDGRVIGAVKTTGIYVESDRERAMAAGARVLRLVTVTGDRKTGMA